MEISWVELALEITASSEPEEPIIECTSSESGQCGESPSASFSEVCIDSVANFDFNIGN